MSSNTIYNDVIFEHKHKSYGAYQLRQNYAANANKALAATVVVAFGLGLMLYYYFLNFQNQATVYESVDYRSIMYSAEEVFIPNIKQDLPKAIEEAKAKPEKKNLPPVASADTKPEQNLKKETTKDEKITNQTNVATTTGVAVAAASTGNGKSGEASVSNDTTGTALYTNEIFMKVDQGAEFAGGKEAFATFLRKNIVYPTYATTNKVNGIIFVHIVINRDGTLQDFKLYKGIEKSCNEEIMRVVQTMPNWIPARKNGISVRQRLIIPINFNVMQ